MITNKKYKITKITAAVLSVLICASFLSSCSGADTSGIIESETAAADSVTLSSTNKSVTVSELTAEGTSINSSEVFKNENEITTAEISSASKIILNETSIEFDGSGAKVSGSTITITAAGVYNISGTLNDGQIIVNAGSKADVTLLLNGADITCKSSAPIYIKSAGKTYITLASGMKNQLNDTAVFTSGDSSEDEPNAVIFCKSDLTINGTGSLIVTAKYNNAVNCKDKLKITGGSITVTSAKDGIKGKDCVAITGANITVNAQGDGIQSSNTENAALGYILIEGKTVKITAGNDAIQAETSVLISGGNIDITSGGGSANSINKDQNQFGGGYSSSSDTTSVSMKGIKAAGDITVKGGTINIDSADDALHSNNSLTISGGGIVISAGDDGIHADTLATISGGNITITKSYEGIESADIVINAGNINVTSSDDGINAAGGNDNSSVNGRPGQNSFSTGGDYSLSINGGYITVNGNGDGVDINGAITMTAGTLIINGPTSDGNGALDYDSGCKVTGGTILAVGSSGMALAPDETSTVYSVKINFDSTLSAGTMVHIETQSGENVLTFVPVKNYQSVVLCSSTLKQGTTYKVFTGGSSSGTAKDGLYTAGSYTGGTQYTDFTVASVVTSLGSNSGMGGGKGGFGRP